MQIKELPCPFFINGEWTTPKLSGTPVHNPSAGDVIAQCPVGGAAEVNAAVDAAAAAFPELVADARRRARPRSFQVQGADGGRF